MTAKNREWNAALDTAAEALRNSLVDPPTMAQDDVLEDAAVAIRALKRPVDLDSGHEAKLACAQRELSMRRRVYPRWVLHGKMTAAEAEREISLMAAIVADYEDPDLFSKG